ncbi:MAG: PD-(D/E)XK nuclease family protein [Bacteroidales bacterium]|nr:PD-(D/E)XK nuclease family protein [Bacteroidales bacterium]MDD3201856.1 PD-(D/E)XK nuclease family protein [Bacteroidales bacterium]
MKAFLSQVARSFYSRHGDGVSELCFVFPNRRSSLFFQKYLGQCASKPIFSPTLLTINDLFVNLSGYTLVNKIEALYILYQHYSLLTGNGESFDEFVYWGDVLLNDFDDIDKYMADVGKLFANVKDLKDLDTGYEYLSETQISAIRQFWGNFLSNPASHELVVAQPHKAEGSIDKKQLFRETWSVLYPLYCDFKADLESRGMAYEGMIYRHVSEILSGAKGEPSQKLAMTDTLRGYGPIIFVGQNALNKCEKVLLSFIRDELGGDFYWDYYGDMVTDRENKSSLFMHENVELFPSLYPLSLQDNTVTRKPHYKIVSVSSATGQAQKVSLILSELLREQPEVAEETAIVLPDENLLAPMLNAIPEEIKAVNVTMGSPLSNTSVSTFMLLIEQLQKNRRVSGGSVWFYHKNVTALIEHPFVAAIAYGQAQKLKKEIRDGNIIFVSQKELTAAGEIFALLFGSPDSSEEIPDYQIAILQYVQKYLPDIDREYAYNYYKSVVKIRDLHIPMEPQTYYRLLAQLVAVITIPFRGEPLSGVQIMGPLETRALDFKNVIMLSVNEGTFPSKSVSSSFIPYNLRRGFDLPTYEFQDSISAYHFYRSIFRAENVILLYTSNTDGLRSGEVSRYVKQLKYHYQVPLEEVVTTYSLKGEADIEPTSVVKSDEVMARLYERFIDGNSSFSASSINEYIGCSLKFYYSHVLKIKKEDEVVEELDAGLFGSVFHSVMEQLYSGDIQHELHSEELDLKLKDTKRLDKLIDEAFEQVAVIKKIEGRNLITKELIKRFVLQVLKIDRGMTPFVYVGSEKKMNATLSVMGGQKSVNLFGIIDRMDSNIASNICRIVDYKTGKVDNSATFKEVADLFDPSNAHRPYIALQLMFYNLLARSHNASVNYSTCVYALREIFESVPHNYIFSDEQIDEFKRCLAALIDELFNPEIPFVANPQGGVCTFCDFQQLCNRKRC